MSAKNFGAALLVAAGATVAVATAVPAHADPTDDARAQQIDQAFLKAVKGQGLKLKSDAFALDLAHSTCDVLTRTGSVENALRHIQNATDWSDSKKIGSFGSLAVQGYCPTSMPKQ
ncbi:DUF732 domain-containing protein [Mycobacterium hodleri]|uniref:DUF732 domain-containing protein n=1 Tax=Mycolicibacterium hodleri TaxID=49897 RepID=UPI0021F3291B|nr:DUF732 domain-containing protein [Mycolicibacterium hodleri]MCV7134911.1 DUF732 domain-containing protein [Mycolicibacterium hodleri]